MIAWFVCPSLTYFRYILTYSASINLHKKKVPYTPTDRTRHYQTFIIFIWKLCFCLLVFATFEPLLMGFSVPFFRMITNINLRLILLHNWIKKNHAAVARGSGLCRPIRFRSESDCAVSVVKSKYEKIVIRTDEPEATCHFLNPWRWIFHWETSENFSLSPCRGEGVCCKGYSFRQMNSFNYSPMWGTRKQKSDPGWYKTAYSMTSCELKTPQGWPFVPRGRTHLRCKNLSLVELAFQGNFHRNVRCKFPSKAKSTATAPLTLVMWKRRLEN